LPKNYNFNVLRSSSFVGCLPLKHHYRLVWSQKLKFQIGVRSDQWLLKYE
jgi:hypothetical protein